MPAKRLGKVIRRMREQREPKMTQRDLAEAAKVTQGYIAQLEMGLKKNPSLAVLKRIAKALGVPVGELFK
jgi:transcriptional regulator with XRE-family HTH domain